MPFFLSSVSSFFLVYEGCHLRCCYGYSSALLTVNTSLLKHFATNDHRNVSPHASLKPNLESKQMFICMKKDLNTSSTTVCCISHWGGKYFFILLLLPCYKSPCGSPNSNNFSNNFYDPLTFPVRRHYVSMVALASSSKHSCVWVQPNRAAGTTVDILQPDRSANLSNLQCGW